MEIYELRGNKVYENGKPAYSNWVPRDVARLFAEGHYRVLYADYKAHPLPPPTAEELAAQYRKEAWEKWEEQQRELRLRRPDPVITEDIVMLASLACIAFVTVAAVVATVIETNA